MANTTNNPTVFTLNLTAQQMLHLTELLHQVEYSRANEVPVSLYSETKDAVDGLLCRVREARIAADFDTLVELAKLEKEWGGYALNKIEAKGSVMTPDEDHSHEADTQGEYDADNAWLRSAGWGEM